MNSNVPKKARRKARPPNYRNLPNRIFGLKCTQHRSFKIHHVLRRYQKPFRQRATKPALLSILADIEGEVGSEEEVKIHRWFTDENSSPERLDALLDAPSHDEGSRVEGSEILPSAPSPTTLECCVCMESLELEHFPSTKLTDTCNHEHTVCRVCITESIDNQIPDVAWDQLRCAECPETLPYEVVKSWASPEAFER